MRSTTRLLLLPLFLLASCGSDSGPMPGYGYGYGYPCRAPVECGVGMSCVEQGGGSCWPLCHSDLDCGPGYKCKSVPRHGEGGHDDVCIPQ